MKAIGYSLPFIFLSGGMLGLVILSSLKKDPPKTTAKNDAALVRIEPVEARNDGFEITVDGEVIPYRQISLAAEAAGRIKTKSSHARAGKFVRQGDLLFVIDPRDYELEVRRLTEVVKQAGSSIEEIDVEQQNTEELIEFAKEQLRLQRNEVRRFEDLRSRNSASESQLEKARQAELTSLNSLQSLKNQITLINARRNRLLQEKERAITNLDLAELNLSRTTLVSPLNGVVIQDLAEQDDFVQKGTQLIQLEDTSKVEIRFSLRMDQLRWLWNTGAGNRQSDAPEASQADSSYTYALPEVPVRVRIDINGNEFTWPARITRYDGAGISAGTRTIPVIATVDDPQAVKLTKARGIAVMGTPPTLLRGSYVSIDIPVGVGMNLVGIPAAAFQPDKTVWVYDDGKLRIEPVRVAYFDQSQVIVSADPERLSAGDSVVVSPLPVAEPGMAIYTLESSTSPKETMAKGKTESEAH